MNEEFKKFKYIILLFLVLSLALTIGYAQISSNDLNISGNLNIEKNIRITNVRYKSNVNANVNNSSINNYYRTILDSTIGLNNDPNSSITYEITITNLTDVKKKFVEVIYDNSFYSNDDIVFELNGLNPSDELAPNESVTFDITFKYDNNVVSQNMNLNSIINFKFDDDLEDSFPIVFELEGPCTFNGADANITGEECSDYHDQKYIDTGVSLYSSANYQKDFEVYVEIDSVTNSGQVFQATLINSKLENESLGYPGFVFRTSNTNFELTSAAVPGGTRFAITKSISSVTSIKIIRKDMILYYSFNGGSLIQAQNLSTFNTPFDLTTFIGASVDSNGNPFRYFKGTISDFYIKLGDMNDTEYYYSIDFDPMGGVVNPSSTLINAGDKVGNLPTPTKVGYVFLGWYTEEDGGTSVNANTIPTSSTTYYARWREMEELDEVFTISGECTFNGEDANITGSGCSDYANQKYIDTGIKLFDNDNFAKDFDISFDVVSYDPSIQNSEQKIFMNAKYELTSAGWPGLVVRRKGQTNDVEISMRVGSTNNTKAISASSLRKVRVCRLDGKIYYSFNGAELTYLADLSNMTARFDTTLTFGAAVNQDDGLPFRHIKATLANISVKIEE